MGIVIDGAPGQGLFDTCTTGLRFASVFLSFLCAGKHRVSHTSLDIMESGFRHGRIEAYSAYLSFVPHCRTRAFRAKRFHRILSGRHTYTIKATELPHAFSMA